MCTPQAVSYTHLDVYKRQDSYLVEYTLDNETTYALMDVAPEISEDLSLIHIF